jgi:hypothetical protein
MEACSELLSPPELGEAMRMFEQLVPLEALHERQTPAAWSVYTPWLTTWLMVYQRLCGNGSLADALNIMPDLPEELLAGRSRSTLSANTGGYARARSRLEGAVAEWAADASYQSLVAATPPSWEQRRVLTIDGSSLSLAPTANLRQAYPPAENQHGRSHWPVLRLVAAHELSSGCAVRPEVGPMYGAHAVGEVELATRLLQRLPAPSVLLADRNFGVFAMAWAAVQAGHDAVLRLTEKRFRAWERAAEAVGPGVWRLTWRPSRWDRDAHPQLPADARLSVHLYEIVIRPQLTLWLVSTVRAAPSTLAELYRQRGDVETDLRDYKRTLQMHELRSRSADMVRKELAAAAIAYNVVVLVRRLGAARADVAPRKLSFARVYSVVKALLFHTRTIDTPEAFHSRLDEVLRRVGQCKLPNRPGRSYPRKILARSRTFPIRAPNAPARTFM